MARIYTGGFELNSVLEDIAGGEWTVVSSTSAPTISSATVRSGSYAGRISSLSSGNEQGFSWKYDATTQSGPYYLRVYVRVATRPSASNHIISLNGASGSVGSTDRIKITLESDGSLALRLSGGTQIGSNSSVLSLDTWYRVELKFDASQASGADVVEARLDGISFASSSTETLSNVFAFSVGGNLDDEAQTTGEWFFDDIAFNDSTGSLQNSWPGEGKVIYLKPNAVGDNSQWTPTSGDNYTNVDEVTPDNNTTKVESTTAGQIDDYNLEASGLAAGDTINVVQVGVVFGATASTGGSGFKTRIKASSGGTVEESAEIVPASTSWRFNDVSIPRNYKLTLYDLPGASTSSWTASDLDNAQIGLNLSTDGTNSAFATKVWLVVDYTPATALAVSKSESITLSESTNQTLVDNVSVSESMSLSEALNAALVHTLQVSDSLAVSEAIKLLFESLVSISENITLSEDTKLLLESFINCSESIGLSEAFTLTLAHTLLASDSVTLSEAVNATLVHTLAASESVTLSESIKQLLLSSIAISDSVTTSESIGVAIVSVGDLSVFVSDSVAASENIKLLLESFVSTTESANISESVKALTESHVRVAENVSLSEALSAVLVSLITAQEAVTVAEAVKLLEQSFIQTSESVAVSENLAPLLSSFINRSESITVAESLAGAVIIGVSVNESITISEAAVQQVQVGVIVNDSVAVIESLLALLEFDKPTTPTPLRSKANRTTLLTSRHVTIIRSRRK